MFYREIVYWSYDSVWYWSDNSLRSSVALALNRICPSSPISITLLAIMIPGPQIFRLLRISLTTKAGPLVYSYSKHVLFQKGASLCYIWQVSHAVQLLG